MIRTTLGACLILVVSMNPSWAQMVCNDRKTAEKVLKHQFGERRAAFGVTNVGNLLVIYVSKDGKTWTAARLMPSGVVCLIGAGTDWQWLPHGMRIRLAQ